MAPSECLVVVCSTWGDLSLVGRGRANLVERLLGTLPMDEFRVGFIPHPNIEHGNGPTPAGVFAPQLANGLIMAPIEDGWRALLIAADVIVGDSGSTTQYGAAIGTPVLLAAFGFEQMPSDAPLADFGRGAPRLDLEKPLPQQILDARDRGQGFDFGPILADGQPSERILAKTYEMLGIPAWEGTAQQRLPDPPTRPECRPTSAWRFIVHFGPDLATWERLPVSQTEADGPLVVRAACTDRRLWAAAEVLLDHDQHRTPEHAREAAEILLEEWPHTRAASAATGAGSAVIMLRNGTAYSLECEPRSLDVIAAALPAWLSERVPKSAGLPEVPDPLVDFERRFEPPPALVAL